MYLYRDNNCFNCKTSEKHFVSVFHFFFLLFQKYIDQNKYLKNISNRFMYIFIHLRKCAYTISIKVLTYIYI